MHDGATKLRLAHAEAAPALDPFGDEEGQLVLRCPGLSGETKLAWGLLRQRSGWGTDRVWGWGDRTFRISARDISEHQGVDSASGRRRRNDLAARGLIDVKHRCAVSGDWTVSLVRPSEALAEVLGLVKQDPQRVLPLEEPTLPEATSETPGDGLADATASGSDHGKGAGGSVDGSAGPQFLVTAEPPLARAPSGHQNTLVVSDLSTDIDIGRPSDHPLRVTTSKDQAGGSVHADRGGSVHASAYPQAEELALTQQLQVRRRQLGLAAADDETAITKTAAVAAAMIRRLPDERSQSMARERWISVIIRTVDDQQLKLSPCVKVACAIVEGRLKKEVVEEIFAELRRHRERGTLTSTPGAYFVGSAKRAFSRLGLAWEAPRASERKPRPK